ncbi:MULTISPECIES: molybdopterin-guanine dinucleotide biosynthesis protein B [Cohnella]|uniref:molybdopterin-guanine dinucleotide biosynthesis protein B n=1 Tax=Cohnella TaxID=329857 RepID=UPI001593D317|nr:molybdopterin-guanine dinucleotide biosynthesis protein B [Cohnella massiliensis]MBN2983160.1 molybdopterin-guanine dinucleotide biosynthesis protein B [Cohnella algarum]
MNILQVVGFKNAGKTTLVCELVTALARDGLKIGTLKRDEHDSFEPDVPGTDSWRHRQAGAAVTAIASPSRTAWFAGVPRTLDELIDGMRPYGLDLLLAEGFKSAPYPKIAILRSEADRELLSLPGVAAAMLREDSPRAQAEAAGLGIPAFGSEGADRQALISFARRLIGSGIRGE